MIKKVEKVEKTESCACNSCNCGCCCGKILVVLLALLWAIAAIFACFYSHKLYQLNILSAGWEENFSKMNELYNSEAFKQYATERTNSTIEDFNAQYWNTEANNWETITSDEDSTNNVTEDNQAGDQWSLSNDEIASLKTNWVIYGPENAKITILEFADASCGYCKRQIAQDNTVDAVMAHYPNDVHVVFKNFPIFNETAAQAMACSEDYLTPENYHEYVIAVFSADDATSVDVLANLAANYGADATTIANCVNNGDKANEVSETMNEWQTFGISGTPSSVVINNESGKFLLIPGAYPVETFVETIESLLN